MVVFRDIGVIKSAFCKGDFQVPPDVAFLYAIALIPAVIDSMPCTGDVQYLPLQR